MANGYEDPIVLHRRHLNTIVKIAVSCSTLKELQSHLFFLVDAAESKFRGIPLERFQRMDERRFSAPFAESFRIRIEKVRTLDDQVLLVIANARQIVETKDQTVWQNFDTIMTHHQERDAETFINKQKFTTQSHTVLLIAWFGLWLPIYIWASTDTLTTLTVFPLLSVLIWSPFLQRFWLGNPYEPGRPFQESNHERFAFIYKRKIAEIFESKAE